AATGGRGVQVSDFAGIPDVVLGPLAGRPEADWYRAPPGKWSPAQIVHHLAISLELSGRTFEARRGKPPMQQRRRTPRERLAYLLALQLGWMPTVRVPNPRAPVKERLKTPSHKVHRHAKQYRRRDKHQRPLTEGE